MQITTILATHPHGARRTHWPHNWYLTPNESGMILHKGNHWQYWQPLYADLIAENWAAHGSDFQWATKMLNDNKKVRRLAWAENQYLIYSWDTYFGHYFKMIKNGSNLTYSLTPADVTSTDWIEYVTS